jgi:pyocin large subunit-like protein
VNSQSGGNILTKLRANGDMLFFDKATGDFAVKSSEGIIRTLFKPTNGLEYFLKQ